MGTWGGGSKIICKFDLVKVSHNFVCLCLFVKEFGNFSEILFFCPRRSQGRLKFGGQVLLLLFFYQVGENREVVALFHEITFHGVRPFVLVGFFFQARCNTSGHGQCNVPRAHQGCARAACVVGATMKIGLSLLICGGRCQAVSGTRPYGNPQIFMGGG